MKSSDYISLENKVGAHNYKPLPAVLNKGQGVWVWDVEGKKYLDMLSAYSAVSHGHMHPRLVKKLTEQAQNLSLTSRSFYNDQLPLLLQKLCEITQLDTALPMNTGGEAVESAIKAARRWGYEVKDIPDNQAEIIVCQRNFHGRTTTIVSFSTEPSYKLHFGPFTPGFKIIPFGDATALEKAITPNTCAFLTEPIQGEAGIYLPPQGWLKQVRDICNKHNVLLLADEVQTGLGRTGKLFACQHENVKPDIYILGKALGGGLLPVSALVGKREVMDTFNPGSHGSTFGGNPLAAAIALEAMQVIIDEKLAERSQELGTYFIQKLRSIKSPLIQEIRGIGLWVGMDFDRTKITARQVCERLQEKGILSKDNRETTIRLAPPLIIEKETLDWAIATLDETLRELA